jgi:GNAT superfamily N-acetyltransferase
MASAGREKAASGWCMMTSGESPIKAAIKSFVAQPADLDLVSNIVETTISAIYPLYYPCDVVQYFLDLHAPDRILVDIDAGFVSLFESDSVMVGTGTIHGNEITRVFVLPEFQRRGHGSIIMNQLEDIVFKTHSVVKLSSSFPAFGMYLKRGYIPKTWRRLTTPRGQFLCYHNMEKGKVSASDR